MKKKALLTLMIFLVACHASSLWANPLKEKFEEATRAYHDGNYERAVDLYEETLRIHPKFAPSYYYLGLTYQKMNKNSPRVKEMFEKTVELDKDHALAHEQLGKIAYSQARFDEAVKHSTAAVAANPQLVSAKMTLAWTYLLGKSMPEEAIPLFKDVADTYDLSYAHLGLGMAYMMNGQRIEVMEMVTDLRRKGARNLAVELEDMIRQGKDYEPKAPGMPVFEQPSGESTLVSSRKPQPRQVPLPSRAPAPDVPVRLSGNIDAPSQGHKQSHQGTSDAVSPQERIRALQERSRSLSAGSGY